MLRAVIDQPLESVLALSSEPPVNSGGCTPEPSVQTKHLAAFAEVPREGLLAAAAAGGDPAGLSHRPGETTAGPCDGLSESWPLRPVEARILLIRPGPDLHRPWRFRLEPPRVSPSP